MRTDPAIGLLVAGALVAGVLAAAGTARADQDDPRLDALFTELKAAQEAEAARVIEMAIWQIWLAPDDRVVRQLMAQGIAAMTRRDYRAALGKFDQVVAIAPDFAEGWNKRATVHYLMGNHEQSLHDIERTLALEPRHFGALSGRGLVYLELEEEELALESFEAALDIHPLLPGAGHNARALRQRLDEREI